MWKKTFCRKNLALDFSFQIFKKENSVSEVSVTLLFQVIYHGRNGSNCTRIIICMYLLSALSGTTAYFAHQNKSKCITKIWIIFFHVVVTVLSALSTAITPSANSVFTFRFVFLFVTCDQSTFRKHGLVFTRAHTHIHTWIQTQSTFDRYIILLWSHCKL